MKASIAGTASVQLGARAARPDSGRPTHVYALVGRATPASASRPSGAAGRSTPASAHSDARLITSVCRDGSRNPHEHELYGALERLRPQR